MSNTIVGSPSSAVALNYTGAVTPDTLLLYCSSRIRSLDEQVQTQYKKQEQYRAVTSQVNEIQRAFAAEATRTDGIVCDEPGWCSKMDEALDQAIKAAPPGSDAYHRLVDIQKDFKSTGTGADNKLSKDEAKLYADELDTLAKDLGSSSELDMINLQSLMSQRQTAIQMTTNMISSLNESQKSIAQKI